MLINLLPISKILRKNCKNFTDGRISSYYTSCSTRLNQFYQKYDNCKMWSKNDSERVKHGGAAIKEICLYIHNLKQMQAGLTVGWADCSLGRLLAGQNVGWAHSRLGWLWPGWLWAGLIVGWADFWLGWLLVGWLLPWLTLGWADFGLDWLLAALSMGRADCGLGWLKAELTAGSAEGIMKKVGWDFYGLGWVWSEWSLELA